jgi:hypothetical protein
MGVCLGGGRGGGRGGHAYLQQCMDKVVWSDLPGLEKPGRTPAARGGTESSGQGRSDSIRCRVLQKIRSHREGERFSGTGKWRGGRDFVKGVGPKPPSIGCTSRWNGPHQTPDTQTSPLSLTPHRLVILFPLTTLQSSSSPSKGRNTLQLHIRCKQVATLEQRDPSTHLNHKYIRRRLNCDQQRVSLVPCLRQRITNAPTSVQHVWWFCLAVRLRLERAWKQRTHGSGNAAFSHWLGSFSMETGLATAGYKR